MTKLLRYMKEYKKESILGPLFKLFEAMLELFVPLVVARIIDIGIGGQDKGSIIMLSLLMAGLSLIGLAFSVTAQYFAAKASVGFVSRIRSVLFRRIQSFSYSQLDDVGTSTLITRLTSDANQVQSAVNLALRLLLRSPLVVFGAMIMAFTIDVRSALIFAAAIPVLFLVVFGIMYACVPLYKKVQSSLDAVLAKTRESISGARVIRAFCKEEEQIEQFDERNASLAALQLHVGRISALMNPVTVMIINAAVIVLIYTGAIRVETGLITQGAVVALYNYMSQILVELIKLANLIVSISKGVACANRIQSVLDIEPETVPAAETQETESAIELRGVSFAYDGSNEEALTGIDFSIGRGETLGIIGGTGSGKSTLVNLIAGFYRPTSGSVSVLGKNIDAWDREQLLAKTGIVPQRAVLFRGTIRDNLRWGCEQADDERMLAALKTAQALDVVASKPEGLDAPVSQGGKNFSGGQRQRLTIARALVHCPELLILDDSASALDFATDAALRKAIRELEPAPTTVIVSQRTSSIAHADRIIVLDDGEQVGVGTHEQLLESCPVYKEIYDSQFRKEADV